MTSGCLIISLSGAPQLGLPEFRLFEPVNNGSKKVLEVEKMAKGTKNIKMEIVFDGRSPVRRWWKR